MHYVSKTFLVISLLAPLGASALGVGDIHLHSGMNQSLDAEIPLVLSGSDTLNDVRVTLASPEEFAKAGIDRQYFLSKLQFRPIQKPDGRYAIRVTSREAIREPFLNFMVEVIWPRGRALREYTVLLDPPTEREGRDRREDSEPDNFGSPGQGYERPRRIERAAEIGYAEPMPPPSRRHRRVLSASPELNQDAAASQPPAQESLPPPTRDQLAGTYGPVRREETLWSIAKRIERDPSVTQEQMVMGLYRANPGAFGGNINSLKAGSVLRVPGSEYLAEMSPGEARAAFARTQGWRSSRLASRDEAPSMLPTEEAPPPQSQVKLLPPPVNSSKKRGDAAMAGDEPTAPGGGRNRSDLALEVAETMKQESEEFRARMSQMEQRLTEMQRILALKDEQIATLIAKQRAEPTVQPPAAKPLSTPAAAAVPVPAEPAVNQTPQPTAKPTPPPAVVPSPAANPTAPPPPSSTPAPAASPKPASTPIAAEPSAVGVDPTYLGLAGGLGLLGLGTWLLKRRRDALIAGSDLTRPEFDDGQGPASAETVALSPSVRSDVTVSGTRDPLLNDFVSGTYDVLGSEADEVDPISEADVYLAYGRGKQAEELIRNAIARYPDRDDFKLKLLEIFQSNENDEAFLTYVTELKVQGKDKDQAFWNQVQGRLMELIPEKVVVQDGSVISQPAWEDEPHALGLGDLDLSDESLINDLRKFEDQAREEPRARLGDIDLSDSALVDGLDQMPQENGRTAQDSASHASRSRGLEQPENLDMAESLGDLDLSDAEWVEDFADEGRQGASSSETDFSLLPELDFIGDKGEKIDSAQDSALASIMDFDDLTTETDRNEQPEDALKELERLLSLDFEDDLPAENVSDVNTTSGTAEQEKSLDELLQELTAGLSQDDGKREAEPGKPDSNASPPVSPAAEEQPLAFDLADLDLLLANAGKRPLSEAQHGAGGSEEDRGLDFDLGTGLQKLHPTADKAEDEAIDPDRILEFNLSELEPGAHKTSSNSPESADFELDFDEIGDLTDMDPFETKLDLARAYVDMEDEHSAREILSDVTLNGSDRQKKEAAELLQRLDGGTKE